MVSTSRSVTLIIIIIFLTGCSNVSITEKDELLFEKIDELHVQIDQEQWEKALSNINEFQNSYEHRKWKMQLLGAIDDYEEIELEIEKLKETLKDQDELESKVGLREIKHRMFLIYNL
ncbi:DUF4363 family protein [Alteribacter populi]|uniref:DUF4363 family protein n=1 Tax=Alteribacter populi TaxID=2011011 RepID=UPI0012FDB624|nr:DUF4363 family protein [Alteribacter populi]